jgi:hypothetical protein
MTNPDTGNIRDGIEWPRGQDTGPDTEIADPGLYI